MKQILLPALLLLSLCGCYNDKAELLYPCDLSSVDTVTYSGTVAAILTKNCASAPGCHMDESTNLSGIKLNNVAGAQVIAKNTKLLGVINHTAGYVEMPKGGAKLKDCDILKITKWVEGGALNN
jgi:hypothetical protein